MHPTALSVPLINLASCAVACMGLSGGGGCRALGHQFLAEVMNRMKQVKEEDDDRDRFIEYLKLTEGVESETVDVDVKLPSGKDFDYLLKSSSGSSLALEITRLPETQEFLGNLAMYYKI